MNDELVRDRAGARGPRGEPGGSVAGSRNARLGSKAALVFAAVLVACAVLVWTFGRADLIAADWHGWRQADTQVIALNFTEPGSSLLYPRIDWGGAGPGYVESELQLYPWLVSRVLLVVGDAEWPGQLLSLLATSAAILVLWRGLLPWYGAFAAALGALTLLTSRALMYVATAIQPEALCLLLYVVAWTSFLRYALSGSRSESQTESQTESQSESRRWLGAFALSGALAMLVKPTAAQLGISSFVLLLLADRRRLRSFEPWLAWSMMLVALGAHMWHARGIYERWGNSFGVLAGGDSKLTTLEQFLVPGLWLQAGAQFLIWGVGPLGALALLLVVVRAAIRRRADPILTALLAGNVIWTLIAVRFTSNASGTHYHVLASVLAAHAVAHIVQDFGERRWSSAVALLGWTAAAALTLAQRATYTRPLTPSLLAAGQALREHAAPKTLVVVRSTMPRYTPEFHTLANYQDPRLHYLSRTRGWVLPVDDRDPNVLARLAAQGARFYVEPEPVPDSAALDRWLTTHAVLLDQTQFGGRIFRL